MSSPPSKRNQTEAAPITRSTIWHSDGSIVLQAENTQFRVHWSVLALNSSFFREMQKLPQPPDQPSVDGCPVVELADDTATDVEHLLRVLYTPTFLLQKSLPFPVVAALTRLGRKYDFKDLLDTAVERLTFENPTTLEEYDALDVDSIYRTTRILHDRGILYDVLTLARENNILSALPCAYYRAVHHHNQRSLFDGISRGDTTTASLAPVDQRRCVLGREALLKAQTRDGYTIGWLYSDGENCTDPPKCKIWRTRKLRTYRDLGVVALMTPTGIHGLCDSCDESYRQSWLVGRKKVWEELPKIFDLPPWVELKNDL
ncbi:hypothetical protein K438DRAFT_1726338 [Mycena galopus ATCC 62051]|nr:hypothetical protein K438DRAFT_1726338 [Mycena galopus ATCC 62051]